VADPVAIISVVSGATVAIVVPFISARLERQRLRYEGSQERFTELRQLLDGAAERLIESLTVLTRFMTPEPDVPLPGDRLTELAVDLFRDQTRLALRLGGDHEVVSAHRDAMWILHRVEGLWRTKRTPPSFDDRNSFDEATGNFLRAAASIVAVPKQPGLLAE
jgi:hypothetical protein